MTTVDGHTRVRTARLRTLSKKYPRPEYVTHLERALATWRRCEVVGLGLVAGRILCGKTCPERIQIQHSQSQGETKTSGWILGQSTQDRLLCFNQPINHRQLEILRSRHTAQHYTTPHHTHTHTGTHTQQAHTHRHTHTDTHTHTHTGTHARTHTKTYRKRLASSVRYNP